MSRERVWGRPIWLWRVHAVITAVCLVLAVVSQTESGRIFPIMVIVALGFLAGYAYLKSREAKRIRDEWGIDDDGVWSGA